MGLFSLTHSLSLSITLALVLWLASSTFFQFFLQPVALDWALTSSDEPAAVLSGVRVLSVPGLAA